MHLGIIILISFLLHAIWNSFGLLIGVSPYLSESQLFARLNSIGPLALIVLAVIMILILVGSNLILQRRQASQTDVISLETAGLHSDKEDEDIGAQQETNAAP